MLTKTFFVFALLAITSVAASRFLFKEEVYRQEFTKFVTKYEKKYGTDQLFARFTVFRNNYDFIHTHNMGNSTYKLGMNKFGDMTFEEFHATHTGLNYRQENFARSKNTRKITKVKANPTSVNWVTEGAVTAVKDQGNCGSCWAFSSTGSIEGAHYVNTGHLVSLSEQQLMDCSGSQGNEGCDGGLMDQAFEFVIDNNGITGEDQYPYEAKDGTCNTSVTSEATITSYTDVTANSDQDLEDAVVLAPVSVAVEADQAVFQFYSSGVLSDPSCGTDLDHGVLAVGYDTDATAGKYWIVKNSWGSDWGMDGYLWIARQDGAGECGINMMASYPVV